MIPGFCLLIMKLCKKNKVLLAMADESVANDFSICIYNTVSPYRLMENNFTLRYPENLNNFQSHLINCLFRTHWVFGKPIFQGLEFL